MNLQQHEGVQGRGSLQGKRPVLNPDICGFLAGACSGMTKCLTGHPFDTIKVRMQTSSSGKFKGPLDCLRKTIRNEGSWALYKGVGPPLVGWLAMDSVLLGSLAVYRNILKNKVSFNHYLHAEEHGVVSLRPVGHGIAGAMAGSTVCAIATPVEHIKARLQVQYSTARSSQLYSGPVDCARKIYHAHGVRGLYHGWPATIVFRSNFFFFWASYDMFTRFFKTHTSLSVPSINFWAGGLSAQVFWITAYPSDVIKQRLMTDALGGSLNDGVPRYPRWKDAARGVYVEQGVKGFWRGFVPCFLRAFPANACALLAFETVMRTLQS